MDKQHIQLLFNYHFWALDHLIKQLLELPPAQLTTTSQHFYHDTAFKTVLHVLDVDWSWIERCKGKKETQYLWEVEELPDMRAAQRFLSRESNRVRAYLNDLSASEWEAEMEFGSTPHREPLWHILFHIINHGTEHRTEIGHFLTEQGHSPGELGFIRYLIEVNKAD